MLIPLDQIRESPNNARHIAAGDAADAALAASIATVGLLQPLLVVPAAGNAGYVLRAGHRRLRAVRALRWGSVACAVYHEPDGGAVPETAISAAENMVRAAMHPVDQWRAITELRAQGGYNLETAAAALGIAPALARRMEYLGAMAPEVCGAIAQGDLPDARHLRVIALAPHAVQIEALIAAMARHSTPGPVDWRLVAELCAVRRIPQSRAIFAPSDMPWDEDLFAQPADPERFTTSDIATFLALQSAALDARIARHAERFSRLPYGAGLPTGWRRLHEDIPKRFRRDDPRHVFWMLMEEGYRLGEVTPFLAEPVAAADTPAPAQREPARRPPINKPTQAHLAALKADAVRAQLGVVAARTTADMLRALLLAFAFRNIRPLSWTANTLIDADGAPKDVDEATLCALAGDIIGQLIAFPHPESRSADSGAAAEWMATLIGAVMPRTDTATVLAGLSGDRLRALALTHGISAAGTLGQIRKRLEGALPDWRAVDFGTRGPWQGSATEDGATEDGATEDGGAMSDDASDIAAEDQTGEAIAEDAA